MVGVMIDLGWTWWVSTLIAAGVAVAAGTTVLLTKRTDVRAAAALLAVEAVALGVASPFVMKNGSHVSAMSSSEFVSRADANCAAVNQAFAAAGNPSTPGQIGAKLDRIMPAVWRGVAEQGTLVPPSGLRATGEQWMSAMSAVGTDLESLGRAANKHDSAGVNAASARLSGSTAQSTRLSRALGLKVCFS